MPPSDAVACIRLPNPRTIPPTGSALALRHYASGGPTHHRPAYPDAARCPPWHEGCTCPATRTSSRYPVPSAARDRSHRSRSTQAVRRGDTAEPPAKSPHNHSATPLRAPAHRHRQSRRPTRIAFLPIAPQPQRIRKLQRLDRRVQRVRHVRVHAGEPIHPRPRAHAACGRLVIRERLMRPADRYLLGRVAHSPRTRCRHAVRAAPAPAPAAAMSTMRCDVLTVPPAAAGGRASTTVPGVVISVSGNSSPAVGLRQQAAQQR